MRLHLTSLCLSLYIYICVCVYVMQTFSHLERLLEEVVAWHEQRHVSRGFSSTSSLLPYLCRDSTWSIYLSLCCVLYVPCGLTSITSGCRQCRRLAAQSGCRLPLACFVWWFLWASNYHIASRFLWMNNIWCGVMFYVDTSLRIYVLAMLFRAVYAW